MKVMFDPFGSIVRIQRPAGNLSDIHKAGYGSVLLDMRAGCPANYFLHMTRERNQAKAEGFAFLPDEPFRMEEVMKAFLDACHRENLDVDGALVPVLPSDRSNPQMNDFQQGLSLEGVKYALKAGCKWCIVPPLFAGIPLEEEKTRNMDFYRSFIPVLKEASSTGFRILLENECRDHGGHLVRGILSDPREAAEWLEELNAEAMDALGYEAFGICLNIGHANICGQDVDEMTPVLQKYIGAVVLTDNNGHEDGEYLPFGSASKGVGANFAGENTNWRSVIRGLRKIHYDGPLIFSMADTLWTIPVFVRPQLLVFSKTIAEFFIWQLTMEQTIAKYSHVVLFGAGNMCRNYMMDYGEKYPPLFTCDNNSKRWGEEFCGLKIESPEKLKDLPEDTGIFICNEFYTEIRAQLESMGIKSGIEYFSDRYPNTEARKRLKGLWK